MPRSHSRSRTPPRATTSAAASSSSVTSRYPADERFPINPLSRADCESSVASELSVGPPIEWIGPEPAAQFTQMLGATGSQVKWMNVQPSGFAAVPSPPLTSGLTSQAVAAPLAPPPPPPPNASSSGGHLVPSPPPPPPPPPPPFTCSFSSSPNSTNACSAHYHWKRNADWECLWCQPCVAYCAWGSDFEVWSGCNSGRCRVKPVLDAHVASSTTAITPGDPGAELILQQAESSLLTEESTYAPLQQDSLASPLSFHWNLPPSNLIKSALGRAAWLCNQVQRWQQVPLPVFSTF